MELHQLTPHCWYSDSVPETDRPSLGYIRGENKSVVVDAGNSPTHYQEFLALLQDAGLPQPDYCLITHWHWDHTLGIGAVDVPVIACEKTMAHLKEMKVWSHARWQEFYDGDSCAQAEYETMEEISVTLPTVSFSSSIELDLGGITVQACHVIGPHSDDSVLVFVPQDGMLFAGDSSAGNFDLPNIAYVPELLESYTNTVLSIPFQWFLHSHRQPLDYEDTREFLRVAKERGYYTFD